MARLIATVCCGLWSLLSVGQAYGQAFDQDSVVAALSIRVLAFVEGSAEGGDSAIVTIGVFEDAELVEEFESLLEDGAYLGKYRVELIRVNADAEMLSELDALFFSGENRREIPDTIQKIANSPVLLMGSFDGFLDLGGMVNFVRSQNRMAFEIDIGNARRRGIGFRAKLLRLASRVIE